MKDRAYNHNALCDVRGIAIKIRFTNEWKRMEERTACVVL